MTLTSATPTPDTRTAPRPPGDPLNLTRAELDDLAAQLDAVREDIFSQRGQSDARYIRRVVALQRGLELTGRACMIFSRHKPLWWSGVGCLSVGKILENMEIGHNVLHGQWDWMNDKEIHSTTWEWDFVAPSVGWQRTHNDLHHTWTNVLGKDRDVGYNVLRMDPDQPWRPVNLLNPVINLLLAPAFEWGIAIYDVELDQFRAGTKSGRATWEDFKRVMKKLGRQSAKDFVVSPLLASFTGSGKASIKGFLAANVIRNVWAHAVIFCGHFPDGAETFTEDEVENESRGHWYRRQAMGSANIDGSRLMHFMSGNLSFQIEHHLFPDMPSNRLAQIAPRVREICQQYGIRYTSGPLPRQVFQAWRKVFRLALP